MTDSAFDPETMKLCPWCAEPIQMAALKCKHCGEMLTSTTPGSETSTLAPRSTPQVEPVPAPQRPWEDGSPHSESRSHKRRWATAFLVLAILAAIAGALLWTSADSYAKKNDEVANAIGGSDDLFGPVHTEPNHTPATVAFIIAGGSLLFSVVMYAGASDY